MTDKEILEMLSDIVGEIDYDIWKEYFYPGYIDENDQKQYQNKLLNIVRSYIPYE